MIGRIRGILLEKQPPYLLVDVAGVGYEIELPLSSFYELKEIGETVSLYTHLAIREDAHVLYGFCSLPERTLFRHLIKVNGVGPKLALTILSNMAPDQFAHSILDNDTSKLLGLPGIGKKMAQRLVIEMRDSLKAWQAEDVILKSLLVSAEQTAPKAEQEAMSALLALGYKPQEASKALSQIADKAELSSEQLIRAGLKNLAK